MAGHHYRNNGGGLTLQWRGLTLQWRGADATMAGGPGLNLRRCPSLSFRPDVVALSSLRVEGRARRRLPYCPMRLLRGVVVPAAYCPTRLLRGVHTALCACYAESILAYALAVGSNCTSRLLSYTPPTRSLVLAQGLVLRVGYAATMLWY
eukprot:2648430-Rhodomonas_salina.2